MISYYIVLYNTVACSSIIYHIMLCCIKSFILDCIVFCFILCYKIVLYYFVFYHIF